MDLVYLEKLDCIVFYFFCFLVMLVLLGYLWNLSDIDFYWNSIVDEFVFNIGLWFLLICRDYIKIGKI